MTRYFVIIGAQRSGTTYLYRVLDDHPQIAMARPVHPEPKVFLDDAILGLGLSWYDAAYFADAGEVQVHGEKSTSYLERPDAAVRMAELLPSADVLVVLRDPVQRAISNWRFSTKAGFEQRSLEEALTDNMARQREWDAAATSVSPYAYLERGRYAGQLRPWTDLFGDQLHVLFTEELVGQPQAVAGVYRTLRVDDGHRPAALMERVNMSEPTTGEGLSPDVRRAVEGWFADSDAELRDLVGRQLPWDTVRGSSVAS